MENSVIFGREALDRFAEMVQLECATELLENFWDINRRPVTRQRKALDKLSSQRLYQRIEDRDSERKNLLPSGIPHINLDEFGSVERSASPKVDLRHSACK